ncbi:molybdopterin-dependent oxidoreductase, partial [Chloroflexota bacterium]
MKAKIDNGKKAIMTVCRSHCGGACPLKVNVKDGVITSIEPDDELKACVRGRAYRQRVYALDRLKYPLKRVGERGRGQFKRILWDEALDTVATEIMRVRDSYGPSAVAIFNSGGDIDLLHNGGLINRLLIRAGGYSSTWGMHSAQGAFFASMVTYGELAKSNSREDLLNSRLIIMWGWNPTVTITYDSTSFYLIQAREAGTKVISIDPRYTNSSAIFAHQWIPIRPNTDTAMLMAMAYVIIKDNLHDQVFLDRYTTGFDRFEEYVLGTEDGVPKTP